MKTITVLDQQNFAPTSEVANRASYTVRHAARVVLTDETGAVALLHAKVRNYYYKLPGGGIEENEDTEKALAREI